MCQFDIGEPESCRPTSPATCLVRLAEPIEGRRREPPWQVAMTTSAPTMSLVLRRRYLWLPSPDLGVAVLTSNQFAVPGPDPRSHANSAGEKLGSARPRIGRLSRRRASSSLLELECLPDVVVVPSPQLCRALGAEVSPHEQRLTNVGQSPIGEKTCHHRVVFEMERSVSIVDGDGPTKTALCAGHLERIDHDPTVPSPNRLWSVGRVAVSPRGTGHMLRIRR